MIFFWAWFFIGITCMTIIAIQSMRGVSKITWREVGFLIIGAFMAGFPSIIIGN